MNAKKERELLVVGLKKLLQKESKIGEEYRALAEMLEGIPAGQLLDWVVMEQEAHRTLLCNIIGFLKQAAQTRSRNGADGVEMERDAMLFWVARLRMKELAVVADCRSLKSQGCWETGDVVDAFLDAMVMDSEKHQRFLLAVEKTVENLIMSRPQWRREKQVKDWLLLMKTGRHEKWRAKTRSFLCLSVSQRVVWFIIVG